METTTPFLELSRRAIVKMGEMKLTYCQAAEYVLKTDPVLAKAYTEFILIGGASTPMVDENLSACASAYRPAGFIADTVFPLERVSAHDPRLGFGEKHSYTVDVTLPAGTTDPIFILQFEEGRVMRVMDALYMDWELRVADVLRKQKTPPPEITPEIPWTDYVMSDALGAVLYAIDRVEQSCGVRPNRILFSGAAWRNFRRNVKVIEKATNPRATGGGLYPSLRQIEELLELRIMVGNAWYDSDDLGLAMNLHQIWGANVYVYHAPEGEVMNGTPSHGITVRELYPGAPLFRVMRKPQVKRHGDTVSELTIEYEQAEIITDRNRCVIIRDVTGHGDGA